MAADTLTIEGFTAAPAKPPERPAEKPGVDKENRQGAAPPKKGPCRRCGLEKPINRLMLCYRCWVIVRLQDAAKLRGVHWTDGMPHPEACGCTGLGEHKSGDGTAKGFN
jgi:hypothetical protein